MHKKGFTLIELMVTVTIMMIMTSVVLFDYNTFNDSSVLNNLAYDMSLTIRQAQVYGTAVRENGNGTSAGSPITVGSVNNFVSSYGVHFDHNNPNSFTLFTADITGTYDPANVLQTYQFQRGIKISQLCASYPCLDATTLGTIDIVFKRPDPEANITASVDGTASVGQVVSSANIVLQNGNGAISKSVVVYSTGQISVK